MLNNLLKIFADVGPIFKWEMDDVMVGHAILNEITETIILLNVIAISIHPRIHFVNAE